MEVIPLIRSSATGSESSKGDNGIKRHVQEWSRMDRLTGILEHARVEADQWTNHTANTKHKYGKVVDRRARNLADGSKEETQQTKQLEVFQTHTAGCSVQVIRSQTSTTTSSWHNSSAGSTNAFGQWPPSVFDKKDDNHFDQLRLEHSPLLDVSSQKNKASVGRSGSISTRRPPTRRPQAVVAADDDAADDTTAVSRRHQHHLRESADEPVSTNLNRIKSCSSDEIRSDVCTAESDEPLDRCSRFRRSLQFAQSKQADGSGPRTAAAGELENVLKRVLGKKLHAVDGDAAVGEGSLIRPAASPKKPSFITVESLKKTKNSLRHLEPQDGDACCRDDDGIETDAKVAGDSRSLDYNRSSALTRTEEWYNRRKSYGFEKVSAADRGKGRDAEPSAVGSSTDSGICRSTENGLSNSSRQSSVDRESIADLVKKYSAGEINNNNNTLQAHAYNTTVVAKGKILEAINSLRSKSSAYFDVVAKPNDVVPASGENEDREQQAFTRRLSVGVDVAVDSDKDNIPKRHSIAVVSEAADANVDKKNASKKVEFCRTEVHFDTTPGKINIVDMEDKPAPAQLYRPKKRYSRPPEKNRGLPEYRFGDEVAQQHPHEAVVASQTNGDDDDESRATTTTTTAEDDGAAAEDSGSSVPRSILKRQQQQQQQQNGGDGGPGGTASDNGIEVRISSTESTPVDCRRASWSVADRVRQVEAVGFSTRVNFTEGGETTAVGFDPAADPKKYRYSYDGTASPVWYQNNGNPAAADAASSAATKCHEKLLVRIGASGGGGGGAKANATDRPCAFSECFGTASEPLHRLSSTSLVLRNAARQPRGGGGAATAFPREGTKDARWQDRFRKTPSTSWPRCGHRTHPAARRHDDAPLKGRRADVRDRAARAPAAAAGDGDGMPDVIGALDDLSKKIEEQIVRDQHVTLIEVRQSPAAADHRGDVLRCARGRLEYVKDLMSTDETSEESLKADEEVRSYMMAADDDDDNHPNRTPSECENLKKLVSTVKKNVKRSRCSQENRSNKPESFNEAAPSPPPNVTSVLLNHEKPSEEERSQFQPVHTAQVTHVVKHRFDDDDEHRKKKQAASSKRVPVKIVQDNRKTKQKTEIAKTEAPPVAKMCATVSLKQVPMTVQPKLVGGDKKKIMSEKKESSTACGNVGGHRVLHHNAAARAKDKPATVTAASAPAHKQAQQDLFSTGRDSWLNMPRDLGPKLNRWKGTAAHGCKSGRPGRKEPTAESDVSVLEELNRAADEILKAVNGYTDDESVRASNEPKTRSGGGGGGGAAAADRAEAKLKNRKKAARLLQRANSREALLHLDEASSSDEQVAADEMAHCRPAKPKAQRKAAGRPTAADSVANKTTASFTKKIQSRAQNATTTANVQHKIHPTCYGNVSSNTQSGPIKLRNKPSNTVAKQLVDQKDSRAGRYQCKITSRTFGSKKSKCAVEENKNSIKGC